MTSPSRPAAFAQRLLALAGAVPDAAIATLARISIAAIFWRSGQTKVEGWHLSETAVQLFADEYQLPFLPPELAATLVAAAEHMFPLLLVLGLAARLSALALLGMTAVIQLLVYPDAWPIHGVWATALLVIIARGPGPISLDHLIRLRLSR